MNVIFATNNTGKLLEVRNIFEETELTILSLMDIGFNDEIEEIGASFEENAFIKADTIFEKYDMPVIADDSGLIVNQLDGKPGVYSARYAGDNATFLENNNKLISELNNYDEPHLAKFLCCAVFVNKENRTSVFGELKGKITKEFRGHNGFGFDPIFEPEGFEISLAEMELEEKNKISHRSKAFNNLKNEFANFI